MSATILRKTEGPDGRVTYDVDVGGPKLTIELYPGDGSAGERPWRADVTFVSSELTLADGGRDKHAALLAAISREEAALTQNPLPSVHWADVIRALEQAGAF
jgi:hypothetical protein